VTTFVGDSIPKPDGALATLYVNFFLMISQLLRNVTRCPFAPELWMREVLAVARA